MTDLPPETAIANPKSGDVWGPLREPHNWRYVRDVSRSGVTYYTFGIPYSVGCEPFLEWNQWLIENNAWNVASIAQEQAEINADPDCPLCHGSGCYDSGGTDPFNNPVDIACPDCGGTGKLAVVQP